MFNDQPGGTESTFSAIERVSSECLGGSTQSRMFELVDGGHTMNSNMALLTFDFLKQYRRTGAEAQLPAASAVTGTTPGGSAGGEKISSAESQRRLGRRNYYYQRVISLAAASLVLLAPQAGAMF